jgi:RNA polymerase sigma-70 factor (ECF subfamily)
MLVELLAGKSGPLSAGLDSPADATTVARLKAGDLQAFETIVRRYSGRLLATARRLLGNDHDAQDAVQETFISAFKSIASFRGDARLSTWLHRIVVNAALVQLRHRRRWSEVPIHDLLPRFEGDGCWAEGTELSNGAVEHLTGARDTREAVRRCIARLPAIYRSVLVLRDIEELDTSEVGRMLAINVNTVKIRLHRARQALKSLLDRENSLL